jgi:hypothetical protein
MALIPKAPRIAIIAFAEIKAAVEDFDLGEANLLDALARVREALAMADDVGCGTSEAA